MERTISPDGSCLWGQSVRQRSLVEGREGQDYILAILYQDEREHHWCCLKAYVP